MSVRLLIALLIQTVFLSLSSVFGRTIVVGLARLGGKTIGLAASNPIGKAGALDVAGCEKATRFTVMCDSFNIPLVLLVDTPGFVIGIDGERQKAPGKIMNFMQALQMCTVPKTFSDYA